MSAMATPRAGEDPRVRGDQDPGYAHLPGQLTAVHWARAAEGHEGELPGVVATFKRYGPDGPLHAGVHHPNNAQGGLGHGCADLLRQPLNKRLGPPVVKGQSAAQEMLGPESAQN